MNTVQPLALRFAISRAEMHLYTAMSIRSLALGLKAVIRKKG